MIPADPCRAVSRGACTVTRDVSSLLRMEVLCVEHSFGPHMAHDGLASVISSETP